MVKSCPCLPLEADVLRSAFCVLRSAFCVLQGDYPNRTTAECQTFLNALKNEVQWLNREPVYNEKNI
ncbi:MAG: hypothetical protein ACJASJ_000550 [Candidatus Azotimanducaceae bacterium]